MTEKEERSQEAQKSQKRKRRKRGRRAHGTGSIFQRTDRKGKQWVAQMNLDYGKTRQRYFNTQEEAADALNEMLYEQKRGTLVTEKDQTVKQLIEHWLENVHKHTIRMSTYTEYRKLLNTHILPAMGNRKLQQLSIREIEAFYMRKQEEGLSASTIRLMHCILHQSLAYAVRNSLVVRNVCESVKLPRIVAREIEPLSLEQAHLFLAAAHGHRLEALFTLALMTGMRQGELACLALERNQL